jgi:hypothetical protein
MTQGGMLDTLTGSTGSLGFDAKNASSTGKAAGAKDTTNTTDFTDGLIENAGRGQQHSDNPPSQQLHNLKDTASQFAEGMRSKAGDVGSSAQHSAQDAARTVGHDGGGILEGVKDKLAGVFGGNQSGQAREASRFDAGASSAIKSTDLTDGIHEDAGKGIESVQGATARK